MGHGCKGNAVISSFIRFIDDLGWAEAIVVLAVAAASAGAM